MEMKCRALILPAVLCVALAVRADELVRESIGPVRVVWVSGAEVTNASSLLQPKSGQAPESGWRFERMTENCCILSNGGNTASALLDFGRELHGGLRLAVGAPSSKDMKLRVRFGESVGESMSELGERGACNDHAIRDSEILLPTMGSREIGNTKIVGTDPAQGVRFALISA